MRYNLIVVFTPDRSRVLMCRRRKPPHQGMLNFVGGKIERNESHLSAAYRELLEETGIRDTDICLYHFMTLCYPMEDTVMEVYTGALNQMCGVSGQENELLWTPADSDFTDTTRYAGYGNIYHMMSYLQAFQSKIELESNIHPR